MKIALLGARGQLGSDLLGVLGDHEVRPFTREDFDVRDLERASSVLGRLRPDVVLNTTAYHRVDECEEKAELAFQVNAVAVLGLARWCARHDAVFVHFSTDYVFDGSLRRPLREDDPPRPLSVYGASKLAGEWLARQACSRLYLVRSSGLYGKGGSSGKGGTNFVETMLRLAREGKAIRVVRDQVLSPTYTLDLASAVARLLDTERYGLYHLTNTGQVSWYDFARKIFELARLEADLSPITSAEFGARARRPAYSVLAHEAARAAGLPELPPWDDALARYLAERGFLRGPS
ncbi:MAG: NAD(P)-dependent oxidoreductase [Candidatus Binatia bacterium]|nr:MAG: NAD(P)-dependent oxidoreductase [Candidatus Binatia bacterium]